MDAANRVVRVPGDHLPDCHADAAKPVKPAQKHAVGLPISQQRGSAPRSWNTEPDAQSHLSRHKIETVGILPHQVALTSLPYALVNRQLSAGTNIKDSHQVALDDRVYYHLR